MDTAGPFINESVSEVMLNGYYVERRKDAVAVVRKMFPAAGVRWVYYREFKAMVLDIEAFPSVSEILKVTWAARLEEKLTDLN